MVHLMVWICPICHGCHAPSIASCPDGLDQHQPIYGGRSRSLNELGKNEAKNEADDKFALKKIKDRYANVA